MRETLGSGPACRAVRVPAWLAAHWLASSCRLGAGGASNYSLERRDYLCARTAWLRFRGFGETFAGNTEFRLTGFPALTAKAGWFVVLLPHVRAAKLTSGASYWL